MKYKLLQENNPILIEKILRSVSFPFNFNDGISNSERIMIDTIIYTDGKIKELKNIRNQSIACCQVNGIPYKPSVDTYNVDELYLKDANYVIKVLKSVEPYYTTGGGYRNVVRNFKIYLKDPKNKEILKEVKEILREQSIFVCGKDFFVSSDKRGISVTGYSEIHNTIYCLTKKKK